MKIFGAIPRMDSSSMWRVCQPFAELRRQGIDATWDYTDAPSFGAGALLADVLVLSRTFWRDRATQRKFLALMRKRGVVVVADYDDDVFSPSNTMMAAWDDEDRADWPARCQAVRRVARAADRVTVSVPFLSARALAAGARETRVRPNFIDLQWWRLLLAGRPKDREPGEVRVGWAGAKRNAGDLALILPAWQAIAARFPQVRFLTAGHEFTQIADFVPRERWLHLPWRDLTEYPLLYHEIDIGCAPLMPSVFNQCKSPIKVMEYAAAGCAAVASPTVYADVFPEESGCIIARDGGAWEEALAGLVARRSDLQDRARRLLGFVERRLSLSEGWPLVYRSLAA